MIFLTIFGDIFKAIAILFSIAILGIIAAYFLDKLNNTYPVFKSFIKKLFDNFFIILIPFPAFFLIYYLTNYDNGVLSESFPIQKDVAELLFDLSKWFFTVGLFSSAIRYMNTISHVKRRIKDVILSDEFDNKLSEKLDTLAYKEETLRKQNNIEDIWEKVTLIKFSTAFPNIYDKLKKKITNGLYSKEALVFYNKNFSIEYNIELIDGNILKITVKTNFLVVRPSEEEFIWYNKFSIKKSDYEDHKPEVIITIDDEVPVKFDETNTHTEDRPLNMIGIKFERILSGKKEYDITLDRVSYQNIDQDRIIGFGTNRIIDHFEVVVNCDSDLKYYFENVNYNIFKKEKLIEYDKYTNKQIIIPQELYKIFIVRNNHK